VHCRYRGLRLILVRHLDKAEALGPPGNIVLDDLCCIDITKALECFTQFFLGSLPRQIPHVDVHVVSLSLERMMPGRIEKPCPLKVPTQAHANKIVTLHKIGTGRHLPASTKPNGGDSLPMRTTLPRRH